MPTSSFEEFAHFMEFIVLNSIKPLLMIPLSVWCVGTFDMYVRIPALLVSFYIVSQGPHWIWSSVGSQQASATQ